MTTLAEYAHQHFPQHPTDSADGRVNLAGHTVVAHVVGRERGMRLHSSIEQLVDPSRVTSLVIEPTHPTVLNAGDEDPEGIFDLPHRRIASGAIVAGVAIGIVVGIVGGLIVGSVAAGLVLGGFAAVIGGVIGGMLSGGGRYAGNRAWEQRHAPDRAVVLVAVLLDDEQEAKRVAHAVSDFEPQDVRILNTDGSWHSPNV